MFMLLQHRAHPLDKQTPCSLSSTLVLLHLTKFWKSLAVTMVWYYHLFCSTMLCRVSLCWQIAENTERSPRLEELTAAQASPSPSLWCCKHTPRWDSTDHQGTWPERRHQEGSVRTHPHGIWDSPLQSPFASFLLKSTHSPALKWNNKCRMNDTAEGSSNCTIPPCQPPQASSVEEVCSKLCHYFLLPRDLRSGFSLIYIPV